VTTPAASRRTRVRAPELVGRGGWINTGDKQINLGDLRGKITLLDFWTFCCANCLHVLDELRPLEAKYADVLVVIGVHSPKFVHEAEHSAVLAAVERYEVHHPVLDDPDLTTWKSYAVRAWPTLAVVDPEGYVVAQYSGEGHAHALDVLIAELIDEHETKGTLSRGDSIYVPMPPADTVLRFPGKAQVLADGAVIVSDTTNHRLVMFEADGETVRIVIGEGQRGFRDGTSDTARFSEPQGICLLPEDIAATVGYDLVIADSVNHSLRSVRLSDLTVGTLAGTGAQWMQGDPLPTGGDPKQPMSTPWDVVWWPEREEVAIAMAGIHQVWGYSPSAKTLSLIAGTTNEGMVDGDYANAWFAQTSGLAVDAEGSLWLADSETSSLRRMRNGVVHSHVGRGLFDFGHVDGDAADALLQHPLGVAVLPDGSIAIADTYNGAIRRFDPATGSVTTLARGLAEPSDIVLVTDDARGQVLLAVESAAHQLTRVPLPDEALRVDGVRHRTQRPATDVSAGAFAIEIPFTPPAGQKLDDRYGPSTHVVVSSTPKELLVSGAGSGPEMSRNIVLADPAVTGITEGVLHVSARAASCDDPDAPGAAEFPACHVHQQDWGVPVRITSDGVTTLTLPLAGL
jgi:thiol-disulfide isomerase/thioredoxin